MRQDTGTDEIPCADYATFGSAELAAHVARALGPGRVCLMANHGIVVLDPTLAAALRLVAEVETLASQHRHAIAIGAATVLDHAELDRLRARFTGYGQPRKRR